jgi:hypothetical protein
MFEFIIRKVVQAYLKKSASKDKFAGMEAIGVDSEGKRYLSWKDLESIPKSRANQLQNFAIFDDMKMTVENLFTLTNTLIEINMKAASETNMKVKARLHAQISALCAEMQWRTTEDTPVDVIMNIAAVLAVREDENPNVYSRIIQEEKVKQFEIEEDNANFFFLNHKAFTSLKPSLIMSGDELKKHFNHLLYQKAMQERRSGTILQDKSSNEGKTVMMN